MFVSLCSLFIESISNVVKSFIAHVCARVLYVLYLETIGFGLKCKFGYSGFVCSIVGKRLRAVEMLFTVAESNSEQFFAPFP